jgi:hypothetical protein
MIELQLQPHPFPFAVRQRLSQIINLFEEFFDAVFIGLVIVDDDLDLFGTRSHVGRVVQYKIELVSFGHVDRHERFDLLKTTDASIC